MRQFLFLLSISFGFISCATITPPVGGPKDETPPRLIPESATPNFQTNFKKQRIELAFDEWVTLEDVFNQVVISPPLQYRPTITLKGKTVRFDFDSREVLRENATYTINFGEAVKDLTEKNPANNLRFVFSTGAVLDSLTISGTIVDALKGEPVEKVLFMLYDNLADSVVRTERPFYFAKTDKQGNFRIENARAGTFKGFALKDVDFNYRYNLASEQIGFPDSLIVLGDSSKPLLIRLFEEEKPLRILEENTQNYGHAKLTFNQPPYNLDLSYQDVQQQIQYEYDQDTLHVWYDQASPQEWALYIRRDSVLNDTVLIPALPKDDFLQNTKLVQTNRRAGSTFIGLNPDKFALLTFNRPIIQFDTAFFRLYEDTLRKEVQATILLDSLTPRSVKVIYNWKEGLHYELEAMPGAFLDFFYAPSDTIKMVYRTDLRKAFGTLNLTIDSLRADQQYVIQLVQGESNVIETLPVKNAVTIKKQFKTLPPGSYAIKIIVDANGNGRWDTGNYNTKAQPETIFLKKLDNLRANWELEATLALELDE